MIWILHDQARRAVIAPFSTREEAEAWRDRNGLAGLMSVSPERAAAESPTRERRTAVCASACRARRPRRAAGHAADAPPLVARRSLTMVEDGPPFTAPASVLP